MRRGIFVAETALVGGLEVANFFDLVAEELDTQRVVFGGRKDVENAAAHGDVAAPLDQIGAAVAGGNQPFDDVVQVGGVADVQRDGFEVAEPGDLRLQQAADGRDDDAQRFVVLFWVTQASPDGEASSDRV